jgi:hypothetical protein
LSPSQRFIDALILQEAQRVPCDCPACSPPNPPPDRETEVLDCARIRRYFQLVRLEYSELIALAFPESAAPVATSPGGSSPDAPA